MERLLVERLSELIRMYDKHRSSLFEGLQICSVGRAFIHLQRIIIIIEWKGGTLDMFIVAQFVGSKDFV